MRLRTATLFILAMLVSSCGGGSGDESQPTTTTDEPTTTTGPAVALSPVFDADEEMIVFAPVPPKPEGSDLPLPDGSADYMSLFEDPGAWEPTAALVDAFKIHGWMIRYYLTDDELRTIFAALDEMDIPLMLEMEPLDPPDPAECDHGESFEGPYEIETLEKVRDLGGQVAAIAVEQPHTFGVLSEDPGSCRYSLERTVDEVIDWIDDARALFPDVAVGSIEGVWTAPTTAADHFAQWLDAYETRAGEPFAFIHLDINWLRPDWPQVSREIEAVADERGVPFGILHNGGLATDNVGWLQATMEHIAEYEGAGGGTPQHLILQSWVDLPDQLLPADDIGAFTHLIHRYGGKRPVFGQPTVNGTTLTGNVTDTDGNAVEGLDVSVARTPLDGSGQTITVSGVAPDGATAGLIAIRVNAEDSTPGPAQVRLYDVSYREDGASELVPNPDFAAGLDAWGVYGDDPGSVTVVPNDSGSGEMIAIDASPDQATYIDGDRFVVTGGAPYEFSATIGVPPESIDTATVAVVFLSDSEVARQTIPFRPQEIEVGRSITDADGRYEISPIEPFSGDSRIRVVTPGTVDTWPASLDFVFD